MDVYIVGVLSLGFLFYIFVTFLIYWLIPGKAKKYFILFASVLFCFSNDIYGTVFVITYLSAVYFISKRIKSKTELFLCAFLVLMPLLATKYLNDIISVFIKEFEPFHFSILGISFISFRVLSYLIESFKGRINDCSFADYLLYIVFYPAYLSGPIEKSIEFLEQIDKDKNLSWNDFVSSLIIICYGFAVKMILADRLSGIVLAVFNGYEKYTRYCIFAMLTYPIYIYADFCGYSYIALGVGKLFGYELTDNFKQPYLSLSIKEFWNRWHISLNNWFRDYLYIPLGGNRKGRIRKYLNILIVFAVSGIWHGAGLGYLVWGLLNGLYQIIGDLTEGYRANLYRRLKLDNSIFQKFIKRVSTYILISVTWIFFSQGLKDGISVLLSLFLPRKIGLSDFALDVCAIAGSSKTEVMIIVFMTAVVFAVDYFEYRGYLLSRLIPKQNIIVRYAVILFLILLTMVFGKYGNSYNPNNFIYIDF